MEQEKQIGGNSDQQVAEQAVFDSPDNFFEQLEESVNGGIADSSPVETSQATEATHNSDFGSEQVTQDASQSGSNNVEQAIDWKQRYKDSSREAIKMAEEMKNLRPFIPVLEAMKKDSGLVEHVRDYLQSGGTPSKNVKDRLGLGEDFIFDANEAMSNPESDSAKVMGTYVDSMVNSRVNNILKREKVNAMRVQQDVMRRKQEAEFRKKHQMSDDDYAAMVSEARNHKLSLDDIYYILNKDKAAANVANSTKQDMLNQMKNVRNIPTSASDANSQAQPVSTNDKIFDSILDLDSGIDNLFS